MTTAPMDFLVYETDVLVIGGGLAALRAALSAREEGARVLVVVKRKLGRSGSSAITSGGYAAAWSELDPLDDAELHYQDTIIGGGWVNERPLVRALVEEAPARLQELWEIGAQFRKSNGQYYLSPSGDHRRPRVLVPEHMRGTDMTLPLRAAALEAGVDVLENTLIVELLRDDDQVVGALGLTRDKVGGCIIRARATILAAGGASRMFPVTSNPVDVRGGGFALALRAGASLRDMEFIQFYPWRLIRPFRNTRVPIQPSTFVSGGKLYNSAGERFMERYDPVKKEAATRDVSARGIFDQIRRGLTVDGGVILDISDVPDEQFRLENSKVTDVLEPKGIDYRQIPLILAPEAHFFMGGVLIDEDCYTELRGLLACGENAGGAHGGNRLNANAVPETQVFGYRAGRAAARAPRGAAQHRFNINEKVLEPWRARLRAVRERRGSTSPEMDRLVERQREALGLGLGIIRNAAGLEEVLVEIDSLREQLSATPQSNLGDLIAAVELEDTLDVGAACAASALLREESRASHYRDDFPETDPDWLQTIIFQEGKAETRRLKVEPDEKKWSLPSRASTPAPDEHLE